MRILCLLLLLVSLPQVWGCASYGIYEDKRMVGTISSDKAIATDVKTTLMGQDFSKGWDISVYCYYGKVYLVGEVPQNMHDKAVSLARKCKGVRSVTPHWFAARTADSSDLALATKLRSNLISTKGLSSTRIDTQVNANRVVLLGVVNDSREKDLAVKIAKQTEGVREVTSYLMLPQ
ncbi:MAG: BON domain-containing protein [Desulfovibrionaceae bacterium]